MAVQNILILSLLITNVLSAPSSCIESCDSYIKQYQTQTSGAFQNYAGLSQSDSHLQGLDYSKPGTWSEHNDYNINNGHGKVHEERGQYVEGPKTVRYYKKNYTSHSTSYPNGEELLRLEHQNNKHDTYIPTQNSYNKLANTESSGQQYKYNRMQNQQYTQSSHRQTKTQSERLEDLGEYSGGALQTTAQSASDLATQISQKPYINTQSGNWSTVNSYKTDRGHGRVFEEQGQYVSGDKNVRYYKRNYTSNYSSSDGTPIPETIKSGVHDIQSEIEKIHKEFGKEFSHISTAKTIGSSNIAQTHVNTHGLSTDSIYDINNNNYKNRNDGSIISGTNHNEEQHTSVITNQHLPYRNPYPNNYGANSYSTYEKHEGYTKKFQPTSQLINPTPGYTTNVFTTGDSGYKKNIYSESTSQQLADNLQTEVLDEHQSKLVQNQMFLDNLRNSEQRQNRLIHSGTTGHTAHYKEQWTSSHTKEGSIPHHSTDISHTNQNIFQNNNQYENSHNLHQEIQQQNSNLHKFSENGYNNIRKTPLEKLVVGTSDTSGGADVVDCAYNSQYSHGSSQYQTRYKRNVNHDKEEGEQQKENKYFNDDFTSKIQKLQQNSEQSYQLWKPESTNQRLKDLTQKTHGFDDLTQQTAGNLEFGQETQQSYQPWKPGSANQHLEDLTQKTDGSDDLTQQTVGKLEFGQESQQSYQPWKPGSANQHLEDLTQKTDGSDDLTQQTVGKLEFGQESQQSYQPWRPGSANQHLEDLTQKTDGSDDLTQQNVGKLEFGQESQQSYQPWQPGSANQHLEDLTQKTDGSDDLTQQTVGKLEFGQESQQSYQPWKPGSANQHLEDLTQKTDGSDDLTQQTVGKLEFGQETQQSYQPWKPGSANQHLEDLTQNTDGSDDLTQQTTGKLEFGQDSQQSYQPWHPGSANKPLEDLTQKTDGSDDLTQQTVGKLELGKESQQSYQPWQPGSANKRLGDLTKKTDGSDDLTQQAAEKREFSQESQQSYQPWKPGSANQHLEDLTQKTDGSDDLTQQTTGKLEFGQDSQQSYQPWHPGSANKPLEDLTQKTDGLDDLSQQTAGRLEFGQGSQQSFQPWKPGSANQHLEDLTQKADESDDLTQQTAGKLEFDQESQHSFQPWKPGSANQHLEDLTQKADESDDLTQQTAGKLEFGQESQHSFQPWKPGSANQHLEDLTQKADESDDLTQQTAGKLEFDQESQHSFQPWKPGSANQHLEDLTQKTDGADDLTQQTAGKLEFGQESQQSFQPWKPGSANEHLEDLIEKTDGPDDLTQQTAGKFEFGQDSQQSYQPWKPGSANEHLEDLTEKTDGPDDLTQQTAGKFEFGQDSQQSYQPWKPGSANQHLEDLTQKTDGTDDLTQQTAGKLEFGEESQQSSQPWKPGSANQHLEDFRQKTDGTDDLTQQTAGKLEFGEESQQSFQPWQPGSANQRLDDLTQKTDEFIDLTQQTAGNLEFGQDSQGFYQLWKPESANQHLEDLTQKTGGFDDLTQQIAANLEFGQESQQSYQPWKLTTAHLNQLLGDMTTEHELGTHSAKPAEKPKARSRYSRFETSVNAQMSNQNANNFGSPTVMNLNSENTVPDIYELPEVATGTDTDTTRNTNARGDQITQDSGSKNLNPQTGSTTYDIEGWNVDQVNLLHKSNDATVGLQWHYTYHPSDQRQFVQQTDQKNKEGLQQQSKIQYSNLEQNLNQEIQNKYAVNNPHQQLDLSRESQNYKFGPEINPIKKTFNYDETEDKLIIGQQLGENGNLEKYVTTAEFEPKPIPRILETYGGGQYDPTIGDDIYSKVTINPSATLSYTNNMDSWDIREKPEATTSTELTPPPLSIKPLDINDTTEAPHSSSFWSRVGHKITTTFGKAKEKAKNIFG